MIVEQADGWVAHQYKRKFGSFPPWGSMPEPIAPTPEILAWVKSRMIAFAKRKDVA
jgi:DNA repair protein RadD